MPATKGFRQPFIALVLQIAICNCYFTSLSTKLPWLGNVAKRPWQSSRQLPLANLFTTHGVRGGGFTPFRLIADGQAGSFRPGARIARLGGGGAEIIFGGTREVYLCEFERGTTRNFIKRTR